jgi:hypothetical protein
MECPPSTEVEAVNLRSGSDGSDGGADSLNASARSKKPAVSANERWIEGFVEP